MYELDLNILIIYLQNENKLSRLRLLFQYVTNQPAKANSAFHPSGVGK